MAVNLLGLPFASTLDALTVVTRSYRLKLRDINIITMVPH